NGDTFPTQPNKPLAISLPRHSAGGVYTCIYTDEKGTQTPFTIPIPTGTLAITSPTVGAAVPIPAKTASVAPPTPTTFRPPVFVGTLTIQYTLPTQPRKYRLKYLRHILSPRMWFCHRHVRDIQGVRQLSAC